MELQISKTKEELLLNTINYFNSKNRGVNDDGECTYINQETGNRCAIGRELTEELAVKLDGFSVSYSYELLPERLRKIGNRFLEEVQSLHDWARHWDEDGLSDCGYDKVMCIISKYKLDLQI